MSFTNYYFDLGYKIELEKQGMFGGPSGFGAMGFSPSPMMGNPMAGGMHMATHAMVQDYHAKKKSAEESNNKRQTSLRRR